MKIFAPGKELKAGFSLLLPIIFLLLQPMQMSVNQSLVLGGLFLVILWWGTGWVHKDVASTFLLLVFLIFSGTPVRQVLIFPLSENIIMIAAAYLLSQGIVNSKVADNFSDFVLERYCKNSTQMVIMTFVLCIMLIFIIPQPFPRVVLLAAIYLNFFKNKDISPEEKMTLLFCIFVAATITSLLFINGDVIANYAALGFGFTEMSFFSWIKYMTLPTLVVTFIIALSFIITFRKSLTSIYERKNEYSSFSVETSGKKALCVMLVIILLWLTEGFHGVSAAKIAAIGVLAMFALRIIELKDFRVINFSLILFLTAEFAIGKVLIGSGIAEILKHYLVQVLPCTDSFWFLPIIIITIMILHMIMGSIITALSFSIPMLVIVTAGAFSSELIVLLVLVSVGFHYILPFHHVTIMIGYGSGYYSNKHVLKFGLYLTFITIVSVFLLYIPWWRLMGLL